MYIYIYIYIYVYIYIYIYGAGLQFLPLGRIAEARAEGLLVLILMHLIVNIDSIICSTDTGINLQRGIPRKHKWSTGTDPRCFMNAGLQITRDKVTFESLFSH